ncbi:MAG: FHA domain-containing protein [Cyanobacteria bacterium J06638_28]
MIVCPNCNHQNPDGAVQCEACYTPLPTLASCPSCGASVQSDASFCGQCGFDLRAVQTSPAAVPDEGLLTEENLVSPSAKPDASSASQNTVDIPDLLPPDPLVVPELVSSEVPVPSSNLIPSTTAPPEAEGSSVPSLQMSEPSTPVSTTAPPPEASTSATQIQVNQFKLFHTQTNTPIELPPQLTLIHLGKPNERVPPTIDVSGFPNSEIVSRIHANIRVEGDIYYVEDVGSSNGTYINNMPLAPGNRHRLRPGDRIALGKGDKVTFIFQSA